MANVTLKYTFHLENGATRNVSIKDVKDDVTEAQVSQIADSFIAKNAEYKGSKFVSVKKCEKVVTDTEIMIEN